jgi:hypothetical protein
VAPAGKKFLVGVEAKNETHVIGLVIIQQVQVPVDQLDQPDPPSEQVHGPDPA